MYKVLGADQKEYGPVPEDVIRQWIAERRLNARSLIQPEAGEGWKPLDAFPEFADALAAAQPSPPPAGAPSGSWPAGGGRRLNSMAVAGLIMGILAMSVGMCCCSGLPFNVLGIIFSAVALNQIGRHPESQSGRELALTGLVLSILSLVLSLLVMIFGFTTNYPDILRELRGK